MAISPVKALDQLEKQVDGLVKELQKKESAKTKLENRVKELEARMSRQESEIERLRKKAGAVSENLDVVYRKQRDKIHSRLIQVLARLEPL